MQKIMNLTEATPMSINVLLKDKTATTTPAACTVQLLSQLEQSRIDWEEGAYRTSNHDLYKILANCLSYCKELPFDESKQRSAELKNFYASRGYKYKQDTPLANRVVRAVFGSINRRRISTYSIVIRQAQKDGIGINDFAKWVEDKGGVQEISLSHSATFVSPKQKAEIAKRYLNSFTPIATAKSEALSQLADADSMGESCVLLAEQQANGSFAIYAVLRNQGLTNSAFAAFYSTQRESINKVNTEVAAANDANGVIAKVA
jgi:hypothetical protein